MITETEINQYGCTAEDSSFEVLRQDGLMWYPWVGKHYPAAPVKVWVIAESHYVNHSGANYQAARHPLYTRRVVAERLFPQYFWPNQTLDKINQTLAGQPVPANKTHLLWENAAFSNLIQRPMNSPKERPNEDDIAKGWSVFSPLLDILKPDFCLFVGFAGINRLDTLPAAMRITTPKWTQDKIGNAYARETFTVSTKNHHAQAAVIGHPGRCFNAQKWHEWLKSNLPSAANWLQQKVQ